MKEKFEEYYIDICEKNPKEASLFALATLSMRHITKQDLEYYNIIEDVLNVKLKDVKGPELDKVREIIIKVNKYDEQLIKYLSEMEIDIVDFISGTKSNKTEVEKQRDQIKKWWD